MLRSAYAQFVYLVGGADHDQMEKMRQFMSQLCAGWDVATVREIVADTLHNIVDPLVYDEAVSLIEEHQLAGRDVVIVSTSRRRGGRADRRDARRRPGDRDPDGDRRRPVHRRDRVLRLRREEGHARSASSPTRAATTSTACYAYSDSVTDVPMLEAVGHPHAVNPDKELRRIAAATAAGRCWCSPSRWRCAAGCRCRPPKPTLAALAVGGCAGRRRADLEQRAQACRACGT